MITDFIRLQPEQQELLDKLVNADRSLPREKRAAFIYTPESSAIEHPGLGGGLNAFSTDIDALRFQGLIHFQDEHVFHITPTGFAFYEREKAHDQQPVS
ncbi:MAG: hypothetical protein M3347_13400 [Armatimonadota bacterium]|nr:hypothetical protein [Armatimonadota bacterium]